MKLASFLFPFLLSFFIYDHCCLCLLALHQASLTANHKSYYYSFLRISLNVQNGRDLIGHLIKTLILKMSRQRPENLNFTEVKQLLAEQLDFSIRQWIKNTFVMPSAPSEFPLADGTDKFFPTKFPGHFIIPSPVPQKLIHLIIVGIRTEIIIIQHTSQNQYL